MEIISSIIGFSAFAAFLTPVVYVHHKKAKSNKIELENFKTIAFENLLELDDLNRWNTNYFIGLDRSKRKIIYQNKFTNNQEIKIIDLISYSSCSIKKQSSKINGTHDVLIERVDLVLAPKNQQKPKMSIEIYNADNSMMIKDEIEIAEKWNKLINKTLE